MAILVYVDDILIVGNLTGISFLKQVLDTKFSIRDL